MPANLISAPAPLTTAGGMAPESSDLPGATAIYRFGRLHPRQQDRSLGAATERSRRNG